MGMIGEAEILDAFREGRTLDCAQDGVPGPVDSAFLRRCCLELHDRVDSRGISLRGAAIVGCLDLAGIEVSYPLRFDGCIFDSAPSFEGANLHELALTGCDRIPGLLANGIRVQRDLNLSYSRITGGLSTSASTSKKSAIWLCESEIGGRLLCTDTVIHASGERSLQADRIHVGGAVRLLHRFTATGEIRLLGARIDGSLDLTGARINSTAGPALDLGDAIIGGSLFIISDSAGRRPVIRGRIDMGSTRISGQLLIRNATIEKSSTTPADSGYAKSRNHGSAVSAPRLSVGAETTLEGACNVVGGLDLAMSDMSSLAIHSGCSLRADGSTALDLTHAELRSGLTFDSGVAVHGSVRLTGAHLRGDLSLQGITVKAPEHPARAADAADITPQRQHADGLRDGHDKTGYALIADGIKVDGTVALSDGFTAEGAVQLRSADISGSLICSGAHLDGRDENGYALVADEMRVGGNVLLSEGFVATGAIRLPGADIGRGLACNGARLDGQDNQGVALLAGGIRASALYLHDGFTPAGTIGLRSANIRGSVYLAPERPATGVTGLDAGHARIAGTFNWTPPEQVEGQVSLQGAVADRLFDDWSEGRDNGFWPANGRLRLDGFTYQRFGGTHQATVKQRLTWIRSQYRPETGDTATPFATQPYEQLAAVYRHAGQDTEARRVAIARRADLRKYGNLSRHRRAGDWLLDKTIKYGYQTWRAAGGLLLLYLIFLGLAIFAQHHGLMAPVQNVKGLRPTPAATSCASNYPCFYPPGYAIDTVIPIINVHQASYWGPNGSVPWGWTWVAGTWIATGLGWALATLLIAGYTGLARRQLHEVPLHEVPRSPPWEASCRRADE
jgi:hypothetical protein